MIGVRAELAEGVLARLSSCPAASLGARAVLSSSVNGLGGSVTLVGRPMHTQHTQQHAQHTQQVRHAIAVHHMPHTHGAILPPVIHPPWPTATAPQQTSTSELSHMPCGPAVAQLSCRPGGLANTQQLVTSRASLVSHPSMGSVPAQAVPAVLQHEHVGKMLAESAMASSACSSIATSSVAAPTYGGVASAHANGVE